MNPTTDPTLAAEREAHFDGDRWRSYCDAQMSERTGVVVPSWWPLNKATCPHERVAVYSPTYRVCGDCWKTLEED